MKLLQILLLFGPRSRFFTLLSHFEQRDYKYCVLLAESYAYVSKLISVLSFRACPSLLRRNARKLRALINILLNLINKLYILIKL
jgi:hypothetical protein